MIFSHVRSGVGLTVRLQNRLPSFLIRTSQELPALSAGTRNGHSSIQTAGGRRCNPQLTVRNVHNVSGGEIWLDNSQIATYGFQLGSKAASDSLRDLGPYHIT